MDQLAHSVDNFPQRLRQLRPIKPLDEPQVETDLVAQITAHLATELHRDIPVVVRIKIFWARAESVRQAAPHEKIRPAFLALAERSGLIADLGYHGREDVHHVLNWALRGRIPFGSPKPLPGRQKQ